MHISLLGQFLLFNGVLRPSTDFFLLYEVVLKLPYTKIPGWDLNLGTTLIYKCVFSQLSHQGHYDTFTLIS